jgi:hypothetical protein
MKSTNKHGKENAKTARQPASNLPTLTLQEMQKWFVVPGYIPPVIEAGIRALAGTVRSAPPRGRPRVNIARDAQIVSMKDKQKCTFGQIARKLRVGREVAMAAYYRVKRHTPPR